MHPQVAHSFVVLGIKPTTNVTQVKKTYRALAIQFHPDKNSNPDAANKFIQLQEAYDVILEWFEGGWQNFQSSIYQTNPKKDPFEEARIHRKYFDQLSIFDYRAKFCYILIWIFSFFVVPVLVFVFDSYVLDLGKSLFLIIMFLPFLVTGLGYYFTYLWTEKQKDIFRKQFKNEHRR
jgi:hypothetical protein